MGVRSALITAIVVTTISGGCASSPKRFWKTAEFASPVAQDDFRVAPASNPSSDAETSYAKAVALEEQDSADCVDWYLRSAQLLWPLVTSSASPARGSEAREVRLYSSSVGKLIETAQRYGRLDPVQGIRVSSRVNPAAANSGVGLSHSTNDRISEETELPIRFHGFSWQPANFERISVVGEYRTPDVVRPHRQSGLGVPLLVQHTSKRPFVYPHATFSATAIVRPIQPDASVGRHGDSYLDPHVLDIVNPHAVRNTQVRGRRIPVAFDLTAPLVYFSVNEERDGLKGLVRPEEVEATTGLTMIEPYQPGKVPVVFIHGLASDPMTWAAMANELFVYPDLLEHYQFWIFSYPTGKPFPNEAANLRRQLVELRNHVDPDQVDVALDQIVLVGHSMGGLISKLQITSSGDRLSRSILKVPLQDLDMTREMRENFVDFLYFEPSKQVRRVIFIGTPHRGSKLASGAVGNLTSRLIRQSGSLVDQCTQFIQQNQDAFTTRMRRIPTSVDLLRPDNLMLQSIFELPVNRQVAMHSIIGVGHAGRFSKETSDGVVPVSSAKHPNVESELVVDAGHDLHHHPDTIREVVRILRAHAAAYTEVTQRQKVHN